MKAKLLTALRMMAMESLALVGMPAHADPVVTFQVPLKLENLPLDITKARVVCWVLKQNDYVVAVKFTDVPISGGQYSGPAVAVPVDLTSPTYAADAVGWKCALKLVVANGGEGVPAYNATSVMFKAKDGTPLNVETKGAFQ